MTVVVGITTPEGSILAADSAGTGWTQHTLAQPKISKHGPIGIGSAGSCRSAQVIAHCIDWKGAVKARATADPLEWAVTCIVPAIRTALADAGSVHTKDSTDSNRGSVLLAIDGRIFLMQSDFAVLEDAAPYTAIGSGSEVALGSLYAWGPLDTLKAAKRAALDACIAAAHYIPSVRGPFHTVRIPRADA